MGNDSDAVAQITGVISATEVEIAYLTPSKFTIGEVVILMNQIYLQHYNL